MSDERRESELEFNKANLAFALQFAYRDGILEELDYFVLYRRVRRAKTLRELREIAEELKEIQRSHTEIKGKEGTSKYLPEHEQG